MNNKSSLLKIYDPREELVSLLTYYSKQNTKGGSLFSFHNKKDIEGNNLMIKSVENIKKICPQLTSSLETKYSITEGTGHLFKRFENMSYETNLKGRLQKLKEEIEFYKKEKKEKFEMLNECNSEIDNIKLDIDIFNNVEKFKIKSLTDENFEELHIIPSHKKRSSIHRKTITEEEKNEQFMKFTLNSKYAQIRKIKCDLAKKSLQSTKVKVKELKADIEFIHNKITELTKAYDSVKDELLMHYHCLLKDGRDTRNEGLSWIIKEIFALGKKVILSYLPDFLDPKSVEFLFNYSKLSLELEETDKEINKLKKIYEPYLKKFHSKHKAISKKEIFQKTHLKNNYSYDFTTKIDSQKLLLGDNLKLFNQEQINSFFSDKRFVDNLEKFVLFTKLRKELLNKIQNMKKTESKRIFVEFMKNNYQRKFQVTKKTVLAALLGEDNLSPEINAQTRQAKKYFETIKNIELYKTGGDTKKSNMHLNMFKSIMKTKIVCK